MTAGGCSTGGSAKGSLEPAIIVRRRAEDLGEEERRRYNDLVYKTFEMQALGRPEDALECALDALELASNDLGLHRKAIEIGLALNFGQ